MQEFFRTQFTDPFETGFVCKRFLIAHHKNSTRYPPSAMSHFYATKASIKPLKHPSFSFMVCLQLNVSRDGNDNYK